MVPQIINETVPIITIIKAMPSLLVGFCLTAGKVQKLACIVKSLKVDYHTLYISIRFCCLSTKKKLVPWICKYIAIRVYIHL